jgi:allantoin racemase
MPTKIMFINPVGTAAFDEHISSILDKVRRKDVQPTVVHLPKGPNHLEYHYYEHLVSHDMLNEIRRAEAEKFDAVVIGCFYDPGLREARELVRIPVIGPAESTMLVACTLGHKFSILVGRRKWIPKMESNARVYGLRDRLASIRPLEIRVTEMLAQQEKLKESTTREARAAVEEDGAEVIVMGCTAESGFADELSKALGVPLLDPVVTSWKFAEMQADMYSTLGISHSKAYGYESPPKAEGWL